MRTHAAFISSVAHHHIIDAPLRYDAKRFDERGNVWHVVIDSLYEQRPLLFTELDKTRFSKGAVFDFQRIARLRDQDIGSASCRDRVVSTCRSRWSRYL